MVQALQTTVKRVPFRTPSPKVGMGRLLPADLQAIGEVREAALRQRCGVERAPGMSLRFQRYERTAGELANGPYTGTGLREDLGFALSDEQGHYIFRFRRQIPTASRPDLIVQVLGAGQRVSFETAPYDQVANLRRIDLCAPHEQVQAGQACADDRVIRRMGNLALARDPFEMREGVSLKCLPGLRLRQAA
jgi:hypothetical protein